MSSGFGSNCKKISSEKKDIPITYCYRRKSIGSSSSKSVARRFCAMTLMRRRTSGGNPRGRVPDLALTPARERGFAVFTFAFAFDDGFDVVRACFFTGEGNGCEKRESSALGISDSRKKKTAPCPSWRPPHAPTCSSLCSLSHYGCST